MPEPPRYRSPTGRYFLWAELVIDARKRPGLWFLALNNVPVATVRAIRERRHPDLRTPGGHLEARAVNEHIENQQARCDCWVRWVDDEGPEM